MKTFDLFNNNELGLYVHIPFCKTICTYCDFPKIIANDCKKEEYITHLIEELESYSDKLTKVKTVYIGGGTPNSLTNDQLFRLFSALKPYLEQSKENSIEINSELFTKEQALLFKKFNINRVSIGVQTFNDRLIKVINRFHSFNTVKNTIDLLLDEGINNINIDMIYGLPTQTIDELNKDIDILLGLDIKHISYYSLILEEKTILEYQIKNKIIAEPDENVTEEMANIVYNRMKNTKFLQYEISNYALPGYESIHNLIYWNHEPYIGIGARACGYYNNIRYENNFVLSKYYEKYVSFEEYISIEEAKKEYMMLGLRKNQGINLSEYFKKFGTKVEDDFDLNRLFELDLIEIIDDFLRIKEDKILLGNQVFMEFVG